MRLILWKSLRATTHTACGLAIGSALLTGSAVAQVPPGFGEPQQRTLPSGYGEPPPLAMPEDFGTPQDPRLSRRRATTTQRAVPTTPAPRELAAPSTTFVPPASTQTAASSEGSRYYLPSQSAPTPPAQPVYEAPRYATPSPQMQPQITQPEPPQRVREGEWIALPPPERAPAPAPVVAQPQPQPATPKTPEPVYVPPQRDEPKPITPQPMLAKQTPVAPAPVIVPSPQQRRFSEDELITPRQPAPAPVMAQPQTPPAVAEVEMAKPVVSDKPAIVLETEDTQAARDEFASIIALQDDMATVTLAEDADTAPPASEVELADTSPIPDLDVKAVPDIVGQADATLDAPVVEANDLPTLSNESREILASLNQKLEKEGRVSTPDPVTIKREDPNSGLIPAIDYRAHEEMGLSIEVRQSDPNIIGHLEKAYDALLKGSYAIAAGYYVEVLNVDPSNETALFGLATTYHKTGESEDARTYYGKLLKQNPTHREGINNFMALLSDEAPTEALLELEKLERENPHFSPIPAQMGIIYGKLGQYPKAVNKLTTATKLSPDNISYKYNLAVILDKMGEKRKAADVYFELIQLYRNGVDMPWDIEKIKNRAIFLSKAA